MFKKNKEEINKTEIKRAAWSYFKSDQLGPKNFKDVNEIIKALEEGVKLPPIVCWNNGSISCEGGKVEVWVNDCDQVRRIPSNISCKTKIEHLDSQTMVSCD
jgi:hypothetical protein